PPITSWQMLTDAARQRFPQLIIPDSIHQHAALAREPFEATIRDRALDLFGYLNAYMAGRGPDGAEGPAARDVVENFSSVNEPCSVVSPRRTRRILKPI